MAKQKPQKRYLMRVNTSIGPLSLTSVGSDELDAYLNLTKQVKGATGLLKVLKVTNIKGEES